MMRNFDKQYPDYYFASNKEFAVPSQHIEAPTSMGPTSIHRKSWAFMDELKSHGVPRIVRPKPQGTLFSLNSKI